MRSLSGFKPQQVSESVREDKKMAAYLIARVSVTDWNKYDQYMKVTPGIIAKYGGKFIVRGGQTVTLEGPTEKWRIVVVEFPDLEKAKEFYYSQDYTDAKTLREGAALAQFVAVEGVI
jgi:uncharacterized protein (DUF1330 family)